MGGPVLDEIVLDLLNVAVGIEAVEEGHLLLDFGVGEVAGAVIEVGLGEGLGAVAGFHGVDEAGLLVVSEVGEGCDVEGGHHFVVFVDEIVAVELDIVIFDCRIS